MMGLLLLLLLLTPAVLARENVTFTLGDLGSVTGVTTQTKDYGPDAPYSGKIYYKFRNLYYAESVVGEKRFSQPVMRSQPYSREGETSYDATKTGPLCAQAG